jgi:hypothetical protein
MSLRVVVVAVLLSTGLAVVNGQTPAGAFRTPWGDPDLQGLWTSETELGVPFERPPEYGDRQTLTDAEFAAREAQAARQLATDNADFDLETADRSNAGAVGSATSPPPHWLERGEPSRRTSLVIDPPDGRVPAVSAEARARQQRAVRGSFGNGPWNSHEDFTLYDRCITRGVPNAIYPAVYNANTRLVQGPGYVAISYEMIHETRVVPVDSRPHLPSNLRQYLGDARGHWEGDTLVIRTANFNGRTSYRGSSEQLALTERFRRVDAETLRYEMTVEDPTTWARPWTAALNLKPQPEQMYEYACHEGNNAMRNMLSAARAEEQKKESGGRPPAGR